MENLNGWDALFWPWQMMWFVFRALWKALRDPVGFRMAIDIYHSWWDEE
jgi:hypothetical protein